jgi:hypoxanthine phosphoribosyltransferase
MISSRSSWSPLAAEATFPRAFCGLSPTCPTVSQRLIPSRSFLKTPGSPNIPIQAIGLSLYETLGTDPVEQPGTKVTRTQWLDLSSLEMANLIGKDILIVDEVDDTRTTLEYAVKELEKDVIEAQKKLGREGEKTRFSIFVLHNKDKTKKGVLPEDVVQGRYLAAQTVGDEWICYPWEAGDIDEHDALSKAQEKK